MSKKKKFPAGTIADLHFVSSLPLEYAERLIAQLGDYPYHVEITVVDDDRLRFQVRNTKDLIPSALVEGTLQRWEGTNTRLDARGEVARIEKEDANWLIGLLETVFGAADKSDPSGKGRVVVQFRERDALFQRIIDLFKAAGDVEIV